jgi:hypothetical protein
VSKIFEEYHPSKKEIQPKNPAVENANESTLRRVF